MVVIAVVGRPRTVEVRPDRFEGAASLLPVTFALAQAEALGVNEHVAYALRDAGVAVPRGDRTPVVDGPVRWHRRAVRGAAIRPGVVVAAGA